MRDARGSTMGILNENDILVPFEVQNIPPEYLEYYKVKRNNLFASIQGFPDLWRYYIGLDRIWLREIDDLRSSRDADRIFPLILYFNAHAKMRISIELAFTGCMGEARSLMRDAIECDSPRSLYDRRPSVAKGVASQER